MSNVYVWELCKWISLYFGIGFCVLTAKWLTRGDSGEGDRGERLVKFLAIPFLLTVSAFKGVGRQIIKTIRTGAKEMANETTKNQPELEVEILDSADGGYHILLDKAGKLTVSIDGKPVDLSRAQSVNVNFTVGGITRIEIKRIARVIWKTG